MRWIAAVAVIASLLASVTACSEDDDALSFDDWQSQVSAVCDEYEPKIAAIEEENGEPSDLTEAEALLVEMIEVNTEYMDAVIAVGVPDERGDEVETLYEDLRSGEDLANEFLAAVSDEDMAAIEALNDQMSDSSESLNDQAQALGVPACDSRDR